MSTISGCAQQLLRGLHETLFEPSRNFARARWREPYDEDVLHVIKQYPGCSAERVLAFLRARVDWFGRGTVIDMLFRPSPGTVQAAVGRLWIARKIKSSGPPLQGGDRLRFYPNNSIWPGVENDTTSRPIGSGAAPLTAESSPIPPESAAKPAVP